MRAGIISVAQRLMCNFELCKYIALLVRVVLRLARRVVSFKCCFTWVLRCMWTTPFYHTPLAIALIIGFIS